MKQLIIIGAGGFGREVFSWALGTEEYGREYAIKGFLDDNPSALGHTVLPVGIIGSVRDYEPSEDDVFVCAMGRPAVKEECCGLIRGRGGEFVNIVHRSVVIGRNVVLGKGVILCPGVTLTCDIRVGDFVSFNLNCAVGHDVVVGDYSQMSSFCDLTGGVRLGKGVFMGSHASILPGVTIGDGAVIGAGSVVVSNVGPGLTVIGVPAKRWEG